jgi:hypothetical protein
LLPVRSALETGETLERATEPVPPARALDPVFELPEPWLLPEEADELELSEDPPRDEPELDAPELEELEPDPPELPELPELLSWLL